MDKQPILDMVEEIREVRKMNDTFSNHHSVIDAKLDQILKIMNFHSKKIDMISRKLEQMEKTEKEKSETISRNMKTIRESKINKGAINTVDENLYDLQFETESKFNLSKKNDQNLLPIQKKEEHSVICFNPQFKLKNKSVVNYFKFFGTVKLIIKPAKTKYYLIQYKNIESFKKCLNSKNKMIEGQEIKLRTISNTQLELIRFSKPVKLIISPIHEKDKQEAMKLFAESGPIENVVIKNRIARVTYQTPNSAVKAIIELTGKKFKGKILDVLDDNYIRSNVYDEQYLEGIDERINQKSLNQLEKKEGKGVNELFEKLDESFYAEKRRKKKEGLMKYNLSNEIIFKLRGRFLSRDQIEDWFNSLIGYGSAQRIKMENGDAIITFSNFEKVKEALELDAEGAYFINDTPVDFYPRVFPKPANPHLFAVLVSNVNKALDEKKTKVQLKMMFLECGYITDIIFHKGGFIIDFTNPQDVEKALSLTGNDFNGRAIVVDRILPN